MSLLTNLVSYYKLDEASGNAADSVGSNNESSSAGKTVGTPALINNGVTMSGSASFLRFSGTFPSGADPVSISCWAKASITTGNRFLFAYGNDASGQMFGVYTNNSSNWWFTSNSGDNDSGVAISTANYQHLVFTDDGTTQRGYVDGTLRITRTRTLSKGSGNMVIGNYPGQTGSAFQGIADEMGVWSRALSAAEVTTLYNGGSGLSHPFSKTFDISETITLTETSTNLRGLTFSIAETTTLIEAWTTLKGVSFAIAETIGLIEAYNFVHNRVFTIAETISLIEFPFTLLKKWTNTTKNSANMTATTKNASTWTNETKN